MQQEKELGYYVYWLEVYTVLQHTGTGHAPLSIVDGRSSQDYPHSLHTPVGIGNRQSLCIRGPAHYEHYHILDTGPARNITSQLLQGEAPLKTR